MKKPAVTRRMFLRAAGGGLLAMPLLPSMEGVVRAAPIAKPKRFVFVFTSNGQRPRNFYPTGAIPWNVVDASNAVREVAFSALPPQGTEAGSISRVLGPAFQPLSAKLSLLRGLDVLQGYTGAGHWGPTPLSTHRSNTAPLLPTIDQVLAQSAAIYPSPPAIRSLHVLTKPLQHSATSVSVTMDRQVVQHKEDAVALFHDVFGGVAVDPTDQRAERRAALTRKVVDLVKGDYDAIRTHPRLGKDDRLRLEAHLAALSDLEARLGTGVTNACHVPTAPEALDMADESNLPAQTRNHIDLLVDALLCDRTRVVTYMLANGTDIRHGGFIGSSAGEHHAMSHDACYDAAAEARLVDFNRWYGDQVAYLCQRLDAVIEDPSTGETFLDNTIVYWGNEDGTNEQDAHWGMNMPVLLAGGGSLGLRTGRYVDYRHVTSDAAGNESGTRRVYGADSYELSGADFLGRGYNSLLISILEAMGLTPADYAIDGQAGYGNYENGTADYPFDTGFTQYDLAAARARLPHLHV